MHYMRTQTFALKMTPVGLEPTTLTPAAQNSTQLTKRNRGKRRRNFTDSKRNGDQTRRVVKKDPPPRPLQTTENTPCVCKASKTRHFLKFPGPPVR